MSEPTPKKKIATIRSMLTGVEMRKEVDTFCHGGRQFTFKTTHGTLTLLSHEMSTSTFHDIWDGWKEDPQMFITLWRNDPKLVQERAHLREQVDELQKRLADLERQMETP